MCVSKDFSISARTTCNIASSVVPCRVKMWSLARVQHISLIGVASPMYLPICEWCDLFMECMRH